MFQLTGVQNEEEIHCRLLFYGNKYNKDSPYQNYKTFFSVSQVLKKQGGKTRPAKLTNKVYTNLKSPEQ